MSNHTRRSADPTVGLGTRLGVIGSAILAACATLTAMLPGDLSGQTKTFATLATIITVATILGRMLQSAAAVLGSPAQPTEFADDELDPAFKDVPVTHATQVPPDEGNPTQLPGV